MKHCEPYYYNEWGNHVGWSTEYKNLCKELHGLVLFVQRKKKQ